MVSRYLGLQLSQILKKIYIIKTNDIDIIESIKVLNISGATTFIFILHICGKMDIIIEKVLHSSIQSFIIEII